MSKTENAPWHDDVDKDKLDAMEAVYQRILVPVRAKSQKHDSTISIMLYIKGTSMESPKWAEPAIGAMLHLSMIPGLEVATECLDAMTAFHREIGDLSKADEMAEAALARAQVPA